jgi:hypothetical protein
MIAERMIKDPQAGAGRLPGCAEVDSTATLIMTNDEGPRDYRFQGQDPMIMPDVPWSGRWGDRVYYMRGGKQCWRRYVVPKDPRTPAQLRQRAALTVASKAWGVSQVLTEDDRGEWRAEGAKVQSRVRLCQSGPLTGHQHFVGRNCAKARIGLGMLVKAPGREGAEEEGRRQKEEGRMAGQRGGAGETRSPKAETGRKCEIRGPNAGRSCGGLGSVGWPVHRGSTWGQYRRSPIPAPAQCRKGRGGEGGRQNGDGVEVRWSGHWRELWRGG